MENSTSNLDTSSHVASLMAQRNALINAAERAVAVYEAHVRAIADVTTEIEQLTGVTRE